VANVYNRAKKRLLSAELNLATADLRALLLSSYTFNPDHDFVAQVVATELSGGGYARATVTGETFLEDDAGDRGRMQLPQLAFGAIATGQTIAGLVLFEHTGSDATATLIAWYPTAPTPTDGSSPVFLFDGADPGDALRAV
jgi:hypothetical protein